MRDRPLHIRLARYLVEHCRAPGHAGGVSPVRARQALGASDVEVADAAEELARRGIARFDGVATTPFNDPVNLLGYHLTNIYLTQHGWATQASDVLDE